MFGSSFAHDHVAGRPAAGSFGRCSSKIAPKPQDRRRLGCRSVARPSQEHLWQVQLMVLHAPWRGLVKAEFSGAKVVRRSGFRTQSIMMQTNASSPAVSIRWRAASNAAYLWQKLWSWRPSGKLMACRHMRKVQMEAPLTCSSMACLADILLYTANGRNFVKVVSCTVDLGKSSSTPSRGHSTQGLPPGDRATEHRGLTACESLQQPSQRGSSQWCCLGPYPNAICPRAS